MRRISSQSEKIREKLITQFNLVQRKFRPKVSREITNQDVQIALYHYAASSGTKNEYGEKNLEWLHERLTMLTQKQMDIIHLRFFKARSLSEIADEMMMGHAQTVSRELFKIYEILRG